MALLRGGVRRGILIPHRSRSTVPEMMTSHTEQVTIRRAVPADAPVLAELALRTFLDTFVHTSDPGDLATYTARVYGPEQQAAEIADPAIVTLLAEIGEEPAGYAQVRATQPPECLAGERDLVELGRIYVDRPWHGRGVAHRLMDASLAAAAELGARSIWLGVWEHNDRAIAFYQKCGFRDVGSHIFLFGSTPENDRVMFRELAGPAAGASA